MKNYVSSSLGEYLSESNSIPLKRKYGERPAVTASAIAPLRNRVLSYIAESGIVSKIDLKKFIMGLKEGGSTPAAANMFIKRNSKYFITESKNGVTYFKLSNLGKKLISQFSTSETPISESKTEKRTLASVLNESSRKRLLEDEEDLDIKAIPVDGEDDFDDNDFDSKPIEDEEDFDDDEFSEKDFDMVDKDSDEDEDFEEEYSEDIEFSNNEPEMDFEDKEETAAPYKARLEEIVDLAKKLYKEFNEEDLPDWIQDKIVKVKQHLQDIEEFVHSGEEVEEGLENEHRDMDEDEDDPDFDVRKYDFKDKGRPGIFDMDESIDESAKARLEKAIDALISRDKLNEAEEVDPKDELSDEDVEDSTESETENTEVEGNEESSEEEIEKVEITEFIITVDNTEEAIEELEKLGIVAERVPVEAEEVEVPAEIEEPEAEATDTEATDDDLNLDLDLGDSGEAAKESLQAFIKQTYLNEDEEETPEAEGNSDELSLGDQGEEAKELEDTEEVVEPTTSFEERKIKVKAEDWDVLKVWLEEKGVDVQEMFGGDIETEEIDPESEASSIGDESSSEEISDDDIDFSGISDNDDTKVEDKD